MNGIGGIGGSSYMQSLQSAQRSKMAAGGTTFQQMAENDSARKALPMQAAESVARAATEAKGMFVDTYA